MKMKFSLRREDSPYPGWNTAYTVYPADQESRFSENMSFDEWFDRDYEFLELLKPISACPFDGMAHGYNTHNNIHDAVAMLLALEAMYYMNARLN